MMVWWQGCVWHDGLNEGNPSCISAIKIIVFFVGQSTGQIQHSFTLADIFHFLTFSSEDFGMNYITNFFTSFSALRRNFILQTNSLVWFLFLVIAIFSNTTSAQSILTTINIGPEAGNGLRPSDVAVNQSLNKAYVVNQATNNISVIDGATNLVEATIDLEENGLLFVHFVEVNPTSNMIYVIGGTQSFTFLEGGDGHPIFEETIRIIVIDGITNNIVETITINNAFASGLAVNQNSNVIYVTGNTRFNGIIGIIDGESNKLVDIVLLENTFAGKIAVNAESNTAYVISSIGNSGNSSIKVIDGKDNSISDTITIENAFFQDIDVNPNTNIIYLTDPSRDQVSVFNGANNKVTDNIKIDDTYLNDIAVDPIANTIYVIGRPASNLSEGSRVTIIDGSKGSVRETIEISDAELRNIAVNPNTSLIYATEPFLNNVQVINAIDIQDVNIVDTGFLIGDLVINPNTNRIYVVNTQTNSLNIIDSLTNEVIDKVTFSLNNTHLEKIVINPATNTIYIAGDSHSATFSGSVIHVIDGSSNQITDRILLRNMHLSSLAVNPNTNTIYAGGGIHSRFRSRSVILVINGSRNRITDTIVTNGIGSHMVVNTNTNTIYFETEDFNNRMNAGLTVVNGVNNRIVETIPQMGRIENIAVNINTNKVYVAVLAEIVSIDTIGTVMNMNVVDGPTRQIEDSFLVDATFAGQPALGPLLPVSIEVNSNTNKIYVGNAGDDEVTIIDGTNNEIIETFTVGKTPVDIGVNSSNNLVYISNQASGYITVIQE